MTLSGPSTRFRAGPISVVASAMVCQEIRGGRTPRAPFSAPRRKVIGRDDGGVIAGARGARPPRKKSTIFIPESLPVCKRANDGSSRQFNFERVVFVTVGRFQFGVGCSAENGFVRLLIEQRLLRGSRAPWLMSDSAERDVCLLDFAACVQVEGDGDTDEREGVAGTVADLWQDERAANGREGRSTAVMSSSAARLVSTLGVSPGKR